MNKEQTHNTKHLHKLVGNVISGTVIDKEGFFGLELWNPRTNKRLALWLLRDEEANGPGSFNIQPINKP